MSEMVERIAGAARKSAKLRGSMEILADDIENGLYVLQWPTDQMFAAGMEALIAPLGRKNALLVCRYIWAAMIKAMLAEVKGKVMG